MLKKYSCKCGQVVKYSTKPIYQTICTKCGTRVEYEVR